MPCDPKLTPDGRLHESEHLEAGVYWLPLSVGPGGGPRIIMMAVDQHGVPTVTTLLDPRYFYEVSRQLWEQIGEIDGRSDGWRVGGPGDRPQLRLVK